MIKNSVKAANTIQSQNVYVRNLTYIERKCSCNKGDNVGGKSRNLKQAEKLEDRYFMA